MIINFCNFIVTPQSQILVLLILVKDISNHWLKNSDSLVERCTLENTLGS